jgi:O-antigen/teichoic acid export membrane protein
VLLSVFYSVESLTGYYVAARLHNLVREGNGVLGAAIFPMIAEEQGRGNRAAAEQAIYRGTRYSAALVAPFTLVAILLAEPFLRIWMGDAFVHLALPAQLFASYWLAAVLTSTAGQVAMGQGESALLGKIALATALVNLAVSLLLVRRFGIGGVIAGTLVAYALAIPAQVALLFPRIGVSRRRFLREVVFPVHGVVLPAGALWWLLLRRLPAPGSLPSLLVVGALVGGSCWVVLWFTAVDRRDRARILSRVARPGGAGS